MCTTASKPSRSLASSWRMSWRRVSTSAGGAVVEPAPTGRTRCRRRRRRGRARQVRAEQRPDVALGAGDEDFHRPVLQELVLDQRVGRRLDRRRTRAPTARRCRAACGRPSDRFSTQSSASSLGARAPCARRPSGQSPRRPSCGSHMRVEVHVASVVLDAPSRPPAPCANESPRPPVGRGRGRRPMCGTRDSGRAASA